MKKRNFLTIALALLTAVATATPSVQAAWPDHLFAPYIYGNPGALIQAYNATGQKYFTLAFTTAVGNPRRRRPRPPPALTPPLFPLPPANPPRPQTPTSAAPNSPAISCRTTTSQTTSPSSAPKAEMSSCPSAAQTAPRSA